MRLFFYDTETSDMPDWGQPSSAPHQPHIVQIAAALVDVENWRRIAEINLLVRPDGWNCTPETIAVHGITHERAMDEGIAEASAVQIAHELWELADCRAGHVESFDARIMRIALKRFSSDAMADRWKEGPAECTAKLARAAMKCSKAPTLAEAYRVLIGSELANAHDACADMRACMELYWAIKRGGRQHAH
jgi:DNA polymerase-3 subunit epsilon